LITSQQKDGRNEESVKVVEFSKKKKKKKKKKKREKRKKE